MSGINKVILIGHLGKDPEIKYLEGNIAKLSFSLATSEIFKDKNGNKSEHVEWHNLVFWRNLAENGNKILRKGMQIYVEGKLKTREWIDREGIKKNITEIIGETFVLLQKKELDNSNTNFFNSNDDPDLDSKGLPY
jgi:single-strand DNA-binding protein